MTALWPPASSPTINLAPWPLPLADTHFAGTSSTPTASQHVSMIARLPFPRPPDASIHFRLQASLAILVALLSLSLSSPCLLRDVLIVPSSHPIHWRPFSATCICKLQRLALMAKTDTSSQRSCRSNPLRSRRLGGAACCAAVSPAPTLAGYIAF